jgi:phosphoribosylglycinamide formyltransferase-1
MADRKLKRIAVFASGFGSNLQALIDMSDESDFFGKIFLVFSNNKDAFALKRAKDNGIRTECFSPKEFANRGLYDSAVCKILAEYKIDLIVLAGYMLLAGPEIISRYTGRILNIHPALLPSFKGTHAIADAFNYGVKITGVTVHFVDSGLDTGPIILQEAVEVGQDDSPESLEEKIHLVEHKIYPLAVKLFCQDRLQIVSGKVRIIQVI